MRRMPRRIAGVLAFLASTAVLCVPASAEAPSGGSAGPETALASLYDAALRTADVEEAVVILRRLCEGDGPPNTMVWAYSLEACDELARRYRYGLGMPRDDLEAARLYRRNCVREGPAGCQGLALMYARGAGLERDLAEAARLWVWVCVRYGRHGYAGSCNSAGFQYWRGRGVTRDRARAADLFRRACEAGYAPGCNNLGVMYLAERDSLRKTFEGSYLLLKALRLRLPLWVKHPETLADDVRVVLEAREDR